MNSNKVLNNSELIYSKSINSYYKHYIYLVNKLEYLECNKPFFIFKKKYKKWQNEKKIINDEIIEIIKKMDSIISD